MTLLDLVGYSFLIMFIISIGVSAYQICLFLQNYGSRVKLLFKIIFIKTRCWLEFLGYLIALGILLLGYLSFVHFTYFEKTPSLSNTWNRRPLETFACILFVFIVLSRHIWREVKRLSNTKDILKQIKIALVTEKIVEVFKKALPYIGMIVNAALVVVPAPKVKGATSLFGRILKSIPAGIQALPRLFQRKQKDIGSLTLTTQPGSTPSEKTTNVPWIKKINLGFWVQKILEGGVLKIEKYIIEKIEQGFKGALWGSFMYTIYLTGTKILLGIFAMCVVYL